MYNIVILTKVFWGISNVVASRKSLHKDHIHYRQSSKSVESTINCIHTEGTLRVLCNRRLMTSENFFLLQWSVYFYVSISSSIFISFLFNRVVIVKVSGTLPGMYWGMTNESRNYPFGMKNESWNYPFGMKNESRNYSSGMMNESRNYVEEFLDDTTLD